jgi:hypothetical protein
MQKNSKLILLVTILFPIMVSAQNYINNPYTRYALGDLINTGFSYNRSLGGSSIALRPLNQINYLNPASYTSQDTLSFLFQTGVSGRLSDITTDQDTNRMFNMNAEYLVMGFPVTRWCKVSLGLTPFSRTSYDYRVYNPEADDVATEYVGSGGLNDFHLGGSFQLTHFLSVGANASYLFGNINRIRMIDVPKAPVAAAGTKISENYAPKGLHYRFGLQFYPTFKDNKDRKHQFILGAIYDIPINLNTNYSTSTFRVFPSDVNTPLKDTFNIVTDSTIRLKLPLKYGVGLSYSFNDVLMLSAEYSMQKFSDGIGMNNELDLADYTSYRFGAEYVPVPMSNRERASYFERMHYRIGGHITNTYLSINDHQINDYGVSLGVSLPWRNQQKLFTYTMFDITYEYGVRGTNDFGLIREKYHMLTVGVTLFDFWFLQPKYD